MEIRQTTTCRRLGGSRVGQHTSVNEERSVRKSAVTFASKTLSSAASLRIKVRVLEHTWPLQSDVQQINAPAGVWGARAVANRECCKSALGGGNVRLNSGRTGSVSVRSVNQLQPYTLFAA